MAKHTVYRQIAKKIEHLTEDQKKLEQAISEYKKYFSLVPADSNVLEFQKATLRSAKAIAYKTQILSALSQFNYPVSRRLIRENAVLHYTGRRPPTLKLFSEYLNQLEKDGFVFVKQTRWGLTDFGERYVLRRGDLE